MKAEDRTALAQRVLKLSKADQTEVVIAANDVALTRFSHESVHQNIAVGDVDISVRAIIGNRTGVARTNQHDDKALHDVVARASAMAQLAPVDPGQPSLPHGVPATTPQGAYAASTANASPEVRAHLCGTIFDSAERNAFWCAGYAATSSSGITIVNSNGANASFDGTDATINVKMTGSDSTGFAEGCVNDVARLDAATIGETSARKARDTAAPRSVEPGEWTVILEPPAFAELLAYVVDHFSAQSYDQGSSFLSDGLDRSYFGENVTIRDDYAHPLAPGMPFDYEGQPTQRLALIENGVARNIVTDSYWAAKLDRANTGHALPAPNAYGPMARNIVVSPGSASTAELIASTKRGLLVSRFWYIRTVDQKQAVVTGMTRDGTYLIENGKLAGGVRNLRFNQSILEALRHCTFSSEQKRSAGYSYSMVVPTAKIENFRFTSTTEF